MNLSTSSPLTRRRHVPGQLQGHPARMVHEKFAKACQAGRLDDAQQIFNVARTVSPIAVDRPGSDRKTPLFHGIVSHCPAVVRYLVVQCRADVSRRSFVFFRVDCSVVNFESCDEPPVVTAARAGTAEILECLLQVSFEMCLFLPV